MKTSNIIRLVIIGGLWLWLAATIIVRGGFTLINLFWVAASGILVFVPLWRKYTAPENTSIDKGSTAKRNNPRKKS